MAVVLIASFGLAALRSDSQVWAGAMSLITGGLLLLAVVGAVCRSGAKRAWWMGFALFGWGYWLLLHVDERSAFPTTFALPTTWLMRVLEPYFVKPRSIKAPQSTAYWLVAQDLWALIAALIGGLLARIVFAGRDENEGRASIEGPTSHRPRWSWRKWAFFGLISYATAGAVSLVAVGLAPVYTAGAVLMATCGLIAVAAVGAVCRRASPRAALLGAAVFGAGYLVLIFGREPGPENWPHVAADDFLMNTRKFLGSVVRLPAGESVEANARILRVLERPIAMKFPYETPLEDVLKHIKDATSGPNDSGIPICVHPLGLQEAEKTMSSPVVIELEGVPLKTTLHLILSQLGLKYRVCGGLVHITAEQDWLVPGSESPFLTVGQCFLALVAAGVGAVLGGLVGRTPAR